MRTVAESCGKKIAVAAFVQLKPFPEFCNGGREVAYGKVALGNALQHPFQIFLGETAIVLYYKGPPWKIVDEMG